MKNIKYIDEEKIEDKKILLRVDYNVSLNVNGAIANDQRIKQSIPTIKYLLPKNKIILISHLGRPIGKDKNLSLKIVISDLKRYLPNTKITFVSDFETEQKKTFASQKNGEIILLENLRFYNGEKNNTLNFVKELSSLADVYVNDAFAVSHRSNASVVGIPKFIPSYGGLLLKQEIEAISMAISNPQKPFVAILGGAKVKDKINLLKRLIEIADYILVAGGLANTFLASQGFNLGKSKIETEVLNEAKNILHYAKEKKTKLLLPIDLLGANENFLNKNQIFKIKEFPENFSAYDIGTETQVLWGKIIALANTIIWNGPVGLYENTNFRRGTDFVYYSIAQNDHCVSIVGGGDTISAISKDEYLDKITYISTGGGAMLEFIEKGTLPGIEALRQ